MPLYLLEGAVDLPNREALRRKMSCGGGTFARLAPDYLYPLGKRHDCVVRGLSSLRQLCQCNQNFPSSKVMSRIREITSMCVSDGTSLPRPVGQLDPMAILPQFSLRIVITNFECRGASLARQLQRHFCDEDSNAVISRPGPPRISSLHGLRGELLQHQREFTAVDHSRSVRGHPLLASYQ